MKPAPACRIRHAARFHSPLTLAERVQVFDATEWRPAGQEELAAICAEPGEPSADDATVIGIPKHLLKRWWKLAESGDGDLGKMTPGFENYAREVADYFNYKNWVLPSDCVMEVVVFGGARDTTVGDGVPGALQSSRATRFSAGMGTALACINLGDESTAVALSEESGEDSPLVAQIRMILGPGEGVMLPAAAILWNRATLDGADLGVSLLIGLLSPGG